MTKGNPVETLDFPADPKELACFKQAYPDDDLPVLLDVVTVNNQRVTLRITNADAVKTRETSNTGKTPATAAGQASFGMLTAEILACQMMNFMMCGFQQHVFLVRLLGMNDFLRCSCMHCQRPF